MSKTADLAARVAKLEAELAGLRKEAVTWKSESKKKAAGKEVEVRPAAVTTDMQTR